MLSFEDDVPLGLHAVSPSLVPAGVGSTSPQSVRQSPPLESFQRVKVEGVASSSNIAMPRTPCLTVGWV